MEKENTGVLHRIKSLYKTSQWHDLEFHVKDSSTGKTEVLCAHRLILAPCSPVFEALCFGPMAEKGTIHVPDIEPTAFDAMLQYLYTDFVQFESVELASNILYAAKKYLVPALADLASKYLCENITDSNCVDLYNLGSMLDDLELIQLAYDHIRRRLHYVKKYVHSENISPELVAKLVTSTVLNCDEVTLVYLAQMWAKRACESMGLEKTGVNIRNLLVQHDIFPKIRWHVLSDEDSLMVVPGLLSEDELSRRTNNATPAVRRDQFPAKYAYVHRYSVETAHRGNIREGVTVSTLVKVTRSVTLKGLFISAKAAPLLLQKQSSLAGYKERMEMTIKTDKEVMLVQKICQDVDFGNPFLVTLERRLPFFEDVIYDIRIRMLNSVRDYPFVVLSAITKIPSGLSVTCVQSADVREPGQFLHVPNLSLITGFEFMC